MTARQLPQYIVTGLVGAVGVVFALTLLSASGSLLLALALVGIAFAVLASP